MTPEIVARLRALMEKATPGPWEISNDGETILQAPQSGIRENVVVYEMNANEADAALITALRNEVPALLSEIEALHAALAEIISVEDLLEGTVETGWLDAVVRLQEYERRKAAAWEAARRLVEAK